MSTHIYCSTFLYTHFLINNRSKNKMWKCVDHWERWWSFFWQSVNFVLSIHYPSSKPLLSFSVETCASAHVFTKSMIDFRHDERVVLRGRCSCWILIITPSPPTIHIHLFMHTEPHTLPTFWVHFWTLLQAMDRRQCTAVTRVVTNLLDICGTDKHLVTDWTVDSTEDAKSKRWKQNMEQIWLIKLTVTYYWTGQDLPQSCITQRVFTPADLAAVNVKVCASGKLTRGIKLWRSTAIIYPSSPSKRRELSAIFLRTSTLPSMPRRVTNQLQLRS